MFVSQHSVSVGLSANPFSIVQAAIGKDTDSCAVVLAIDKFSFIPDFAGKALNSTSRTLSLDKGADVNGPVLPSHLSIRIMSLVGHESPLVLPSILVRHTSFTVPIALLECSSVAVAILPHHLSLSRRDSKKRTSRIDDFGSVGTIYHFHVLHYFAFGLDSSFAALGGTGHVRRCVGMFRVVSVRYRGHGVLHAFCPFPK
mmetsp:Transcript_17866/g.28868  ORF Transcript_17866/g.28868 Transcript_17866/m.28868 type:complete len:200 (+) Transcript_17866:579-1178(+)